jgi:DNA-binding NarL/FixJ family response regulator
MVTNSQEQPTKAINKLLIVDDHSLVRQGIAKLLASEKWVEIVGEAGNGFEALAKARELQPDTILMDLYMPGMDGISAIRLIKQELKDVRIVLLSMSTEEKDIVEAIESGACGYISKSQDAASMVRQLKRAVAGGVALSDEITAKLVTGLSHGHTPQRNGTGQLATLSRREKEVLALIAQGASNKKIAATLYISEHTVRAHIRSLMQKLSADNRTQLAVIGVQQGFGIEGRASNSSAAKSLAVI